MEIVICEVIGPKETKTRLLAKTHHAFSMYRAGNTKKHPKHFEEIKKLSKRRKQLTEKLDILDKNKKHLAAFESKTISAFTTAVTGRLTKAFPDRIETSLRVGKMYVR